MKLALFDLDQTLLCGDSDNQWHNILIDNRLVDAVQHAQMKENYYQQYLEYKLDICEYLTFSMAYLAGKSPAALAVLRAQILQYIQPLLWQHATKLLDAHRAAGYRLVITTTTNAFISAPVAKWLGTELIATQPEIKNGVYTGKPQAPIVEGATKNTVLLHWLASVGLKLEEVATSFFYTDSYNDVRLLEMVHVPVVVNGDARLSNIATKKDWQTLTHDMDEAAVDRFITHNRLVRQT